MRFLILTLLLAATTGHAALLGRAPVTPGGTDYQAYYDDVLDITWATNANIAATNAFGLPNSGTLTPGAGEIGSDGRMSWHTAQEWLAAMNAFTYLGSSGWRLPNVTPINGVSWNFSAGDYVAGELDVGMNITATGSPYAGSTTTEMPHLFYNTLQGNWPLLYPNSFPSPCAIGAQPPPCLQDTGPFENLAAVAYWTATTHAGLPQEALAFDFGEGYQINYFKDSNGTDAPATSNSGIYAWAVHDGDPFAVVPIPAAAWLLGSALVLLGWLRRKAS